MSEIVDKFALASDCAEDKPAHDAAGNLTYDGLRHFTYDAWNRLTAVRYACVDPNDANTFATGSVVASMDYDGLGRRVVKRVGNGDPNSSEVGDWETTHQTYWDGWKMIEVRNGSNQTLKQYIWGLTYIDELAQIAMNTSPAGNDNCNHHFYALQGANFNVLGVVTADGRLIERYEYTPYGLQTIYTHGWLAADLR